MSPDAERGREKDGTQCSLLNFRADPGEKKKKKGVATTSAAQNAEKREVRALTMAKQPRLYRVTKEEERTAIERNLLRGYRRLWVAGDFILRAKMQA